ILHGLQVRLGPNNVLQEYLVFNEGVLEQRMQLYPSGKFFRMQRREHDGSGSETIYTAESSQGVAQSGKVARGAGIWPNQVQAKIAQGFVKDDKMWKGTFMVREPIPNGYGLRIRLHEYRDGKLVKNEPFPIELLNLPKDKRDEEHWPWNFPEWPQRPASK